MPHHSERLGTLANSGEGPVKDRNYTTGIGDLKRLVGQWSGPSGEMTRKREESSTIAIGTIAGFVATFLITWVFLDGIITPVLSAGSVGQ
jgi:hypothetical protein